MVDVQTVSIVIAAVSVVIGVANSILINERAERRRPNELETRQAAFYTQHYSLTYEDIKRFQDVLYRQDWKAYDEYLEKYSVRVIPEAAVKIMEATRWNNILGVLVREKRIDPKFIYSLNPGGVINAWERLKPYVMGLREVYGDPKINLTLFII